MGNLMKIKNISILPVILITSSILFLLAEHLTHIEFFLHLAAIPLEVLLAVFIVERILESKKRKERRRQLMYTKSHLFRAELQALYIKNFAALKSPTLSLKNIKNATLDELKQMREDAESVEYKSLEVMEPIITEYVKAQNVWRQLLDRAINYNFEDIIEDMIYTLHFIQDVKLYKEGNPGKLFILEAAEMEPLMRKVRKVLSGDIQKFLDYVIELKENRPEIFHDLLFDYDLCSQICSL